MEIQVIDPITGELITFEVGEADAGVQTSTRLNALSYLPEFLQESERMLSVIELFNLLISKNDTTFSSIDEAYEDGIYKLKDYSKLSMNAKLALIEEMGFTYITDILQLNNEQLTRLLTLFNLIYILKGKDEGLRLCLNILGLDFLYMPWYIIAKYKGEVESIEDLPQTDEIGSVYQISSSGSYYIFGGISWQYTNKWQDYLTKRKAFTAELDVIGSLDADQTNKLKDFLRAYMLPWINLNIQITQDPVAFYVWCGPGILNKLIFTKQQIATASVLTNPLIIRTIHEYRTVTQMEQITIRNFETGMI